MIQSNFSKVPWGLENFSLLQALMPPKRRKPAARPPNVPAFLKVRDSTIPNAGKGMFAARKLPAGKRLGEYKGKRIPFHWANAPGTDSSYYMYASEEPQDAGVVIDGRALNNPMRWANHAPEPLANAQAELEESGRIYFRTTRPVKSGEEIFINYGEDYWPSDKEEGEKSNFSGQ